MSHIETTYVPSLHLTMSATIQYTEYEGLGISVNLCIVSLFSRQIAIGNAGPGSAVEPIGAKQTFRCHLLNIGPI